ncbi:MAG: ATP-binding protein [Bryobacteraceae bacterium]|jgi:signal transduction histidine kinase
MSSQPASSLSVPLESVIHTRELNRRQPRQPDFEAVTGTLVMLARTMADSPEKTLQQLVETALSLCHAHSAGISLLEEENGSKIFRWHGVAGEYAPHLWGTTPRDFSPCGTVLDTNQVQLMSHLDRHFRYFADVKPPIAEALLAPFHVGGVAVGTVWVISHDQSRQFDREDANVLTTLGEFAAAAYQTLSGLIALRGIVATIREPLLVLDSAFRIKVASRSFYETFRVAPDITEGHCFYRLGSGQWDIPQLRVLLEDVLSKKRAVENFEVRHDFPFLGPRVMSLNARKLSLDGNPAELVLLAIEDITDRKQIEEELLRSNEDAQRFAYVAAHDLRAPLNSAMMLLQVLQHKTEAKLEDDESQVLSLATANLLRLQALMNDILAYAQVGGSGKRATVALQEPLQMALSNLQKDIEETGAQVNFGLLPTVWTDRFQLTLVFQNLIDNAIKFRSDKAPFLQIGANREGREFIVSITDNGQGFDAQYAEQIFLPFQRLHGSDTPGSGIGLATCKRIVERMGGRIWAESAPGQGSTFYFTLPDK